MVEKSQISCAEKILNNLQRCSALREMKHDSPLLKCKLCITTHFHKVECKKGGGGRATLWERNLTKLSQVIKSVSTMMTHVYNMCP